VSILSHQTIEKMCQRRRTPLVEDHEPARIRTASYDLRLGDEYYLSNLDEGPGKPVQTVKFDDRHRTLEIGANQVALVVSAEKVNMPAHLVGHLSLKLDILLTGLIMASQSQVDAGYKGRIYALLYNLSDRPVALKHHIPFLRLEFATLDQETAPYAGDFKEDDTLANVIPQRITSSLETIHREVKALFRRGIWGLVGIFITFVIAGVTTVFGLLGPVQTEASDAKASAEEARETVKSLRAQLDSEHTAVVELEAQVRSLRRRLPPLESE
jgi:dCTP deaminase